MRTPTDFEKKVYEVVKTIPYGTVLTYQEVAIKLGNKNFARAVGNALNKNPDQISIPCHRVVNSNYQLAKNFRFGGESGQRKLLELEGIKIINNIVIK